MTAVEAVQSCTPSRLTHLEFRIEQPQKGAATLSKKQPVEIIMNLNKRNETTVLLRSFVSDEELQQTIIELGKSEDDPPIVFGWNGANLEALWNKAVAYGGTLNAIHPPINGGQHLVGNSTAATLDQLKIWLLEYVRDQVNPPPPIIGHTVGLACTQAQFGQIQARLVLLFFNPWFQAVLSHGAPLPGPLSTLWFPRPRSTRGELTEIPNRTPLF